ncbi:MAG: nucleoside triphosphate pyrophosphohydrolase family protein [Patescibacteria group bacterium]
MTFEEYQRESQKTATYPVIGLPFVYPTLGLAGETGEVVEKVKKIFRDNNSTITEEQTQELVKEMGDVLWYLTQLATTLGVSLEDVARMNMEKLRSRLERDALHGDGDNR